MRFFKNNRLHLEQNMPSITDLLWVISLTVMMSLTRLHHAETLWQLPDASVAVFFLAGLRLKSINFLLWFLAEFLLIDFIALYGLGTDSYCFSAAYGFLIPAFAGVWWIGKQLSKKLFTENIPTASLQIQTSALIKTSPLMKMAHSAQMLALTFVFASLSAVYYFILSNLSFFLLSGKFSQLNGWEYTQRVSMYFQDYWFATAGYSCLAVGLLLVVELFARPQKSLFVR